MKYIMHMKAPICYDLIIDLLTSYLSNVTTVSPFYFHNYILKMSTEATTDSEPKQQEVYEQPNNPASTKKSETQEHNDISSHNAAGTRGPNDSNPTPQPTSLGYGQPGSGEEATGNVVGGSIDEEGLKLAPPSEGRVYDAVSSDKKPGTGEQEPSMTANLERYIFTLYNDVHL
jgi:hypothetical protein